LIDTRHNLQSIQPTFPETGILFYSTSAKKAQITQERVEYNVFLFDEPPKGSKSLKIFKISMTFRFDKLSNLSKSVHTGENSQILTVSNKKNSCGHILISNPAETYFSIHNYL
jgi:hypothetical protein